MYESNTESLLEVTLWSGADALEWCRANENRWRDLQRRCDDDNPFLAPAFVATWYAHYHDVWAPVLAVGECPDGRLEALMPLACRASDRRLTGAGAHQCEYQGWLCASDRDCTFLTQLAQRVDQTYPGYTLDLQHVRRPECVAALQSSPFKDRIEVSTHRKPILEIDLGEVTASEKKSGNRSKLKRLQAGGEIEVVRARSADELAQIFDPIIEDYDFRQGAANDSTPFASDSRKRPFLLEWMDAAPQDFYVIALKQQQRIIAGLIGTVVGDEVAVDIHSHAPELADYSPGKFLLYQAARDLNPTHVHKLDLTPGGDPWKDRMASTAESVWSIRIHSSRGARRSVHALAAARACAKRAGLRGPATAASRFASRLRRSGLRALPRALFRRTAKLVAERREHRVYRFSLTARSSPPDDGTANINSKRDLVRIAQALDDAGLDDRAAFLSATARRLKQGHLVYTLCKDGIPVHYRWVAPLQSESLFVEVDYRFRYPVPGPVCYSAFTLPHARGRGYATELLGYVLDDLAYRSNAEIAYISALAENKASGRAITKHGGELLARLTRRRILGWTNIEASSASDPADARPTGALG